MRKFDMETAIAAIELEQMVADYFATLDSAGGLAALEFFTEDVEVDIGTIRYVGHDGMRAFYEGIKARLASEVSDGRSGRHAFTNFRVTFPERDRATVTVLNITFSAAGKPPIPDATTPSIVTDVRLECRREEDGQWRVFGYYGQPVFIGSDPFLKKSLLGR